jgi:hypothetical protein
MSLKKNFDIQILDLKILLLFKKVTSHFGILFMTMLKVKMRAKMKE